MLEPDWVCRHREDFDVFHLHFGFDAHSPATLAELVAELRRHGKPLVFTVHQLDNPYQADPALHGAQLDVLVPAAQRLLTLTDRAADEVERRWGRRPLVLPHPHVVEPPALFRRRPEHQAFTVGLLLKNDRSQLGRNQLVDTLAATVRGLPGARLRVDVQPGAVPAALLARLHQLAARGLLTLQVQRRPGDLRWWDYLLDLDLSVVPHRGRGHSGWVEACYDLGTTVLAPAGSLCAQQRPCLTFRRQNGEPEPDSLAAAVRAAPELARGSARAGRRTPVARTEPPADLRVRPEQAVSTRLPSRPRVGGGAAEESGTSA